LVNYATDIGMNPLAAAALISIVGAVSIAGRLLTGVGSDKIGLNSTLIFTRVFLILSFLCLIFIKSFWSFYLFAAIFGLCYGGEIPQIPLFVGKYFGTKAMATLVGLAMFVTCLGGAIGPWLAGLIFDSTHSYQGAFIAGAIASVASLILILVLKGKPERIKNI
jgi:MFS family permease